MVIKPKDVVGVMISIAALILLILALCFLQPAGSVFSYNHLSLGNEVIAEDTLEPLGLQEDSPTSTTNLYEEYSTYGEVTTNSSEPSSTYDEATTPAVTDKTNIKENTNSPNVQDSRSMISEKTTSRNKTSTTKSNASSPSVKTDSSDSKKQTRSSVPEVGCRIGELVSWSEAQKIFAMYDVATVTDVETGLSFQVQRRGGSSHADSQPLTAKDTAIMLKNYGGQWSWARRAIVVTVHGKHLAASMNGMPHGQGAIKNNNFDGHFCIHFLNSRTHATNKVDPDHQAMVNKAARK